MIFTEIINIIRIIIYISYVDLDSNKLKDLLDFIIEGFKSHLNNKAILSEDLLCIYSYYLARI